MTERQTSIVLGTAGHIDHGKTSLVRALTGIDTDTLAEEKERGISINLGFAWLDLPDGTRIGIVDVPGHERFIRTMLAGVSGIDMIVLVVAADDSVMPQTREHFDILKLLDVKHGLVALTKADLADDDMLELVEAEIEELVEGTFLEGAPVVRCSSVTGLGLDKLREEIAKIAAITTRRRSGGELRLPVDRAFTVQGFGTVVTGTLVDGVAHVGDPIVVLPRGVEGKIRSIQSHGTAVDVVHSGNRTALNLAGIKPEDVERGDIVAAPGSVTPTSMIEVGLHILANSHWPLKHRAQVRFYAGTTEAYGRCFLLAGSVIAPGEHGYVQLRFDSPVVVRRGDRFVIRLYGPDITIGGGTVLEPLSDRTRRRLKERERILAELKSIEGGDPTAIVGVKLRQAVLGLGLADLARASSMPLANVESALAELDTRGVIVRQEQKGEPYLLHRERVAALVKVASTMLDEHHQKTPFSPLGLPPHALRQRLQDRLGVTVPREVFDAVVEAGRESRVMETRHETIALKKFQPALSGAQLEARELFAQKVLEGGATPPVADELMELVPAIKDKQARSLLKSLYDDGTLVELALGIPLHHTVYEATVERVREFLASHPEGLTVGDLRDLSGMSRKYAVPFLEYLDARGITKRVENHRVLA
ncbi:MAG: selenocysteine-specific translation elongation factor [Planctomycetota bacterium]